ncbi:MAG: poly-beta-1,6-N-acetyl-D-glucosamine biosynthesis protein PgaD [Nitrospirota bacterium]
MKKRKLVSCLRSTIERIFMVILWSLWIYLISPLIDFIGSAYGFDIIPLMSEVEDKGLNNILIFYGVGITFIVLAITIWSLYNRLRFRNIFRRRSTNTVMTEDIGKCLGVEPQTVMQFQKADNLHIQFHENGLISSSDINQPCFLS